MVVSCPRTRCVYRCPRVMARAMLQRTAAVSGAGAQGGGGAAASSVDFDNFRRFFMLLPQADMAVEYWCVPTAWLVLACILPDK